MSAQRGEWRTAAGASPSPHLPVSHPRGCLHHVEKARPTPAGRGPSGQQILPVKSLHSPAMEVTTPMQGDWPTGRSLLDCVMALPRVGFRGKCICVLAAWGCWPEALSQKPQDTGVLKKSVSFWMADDSEHAITQHPSPGRPPNPCSFPRECGGQAVLNQALLDMLSVSSDLPPVATSVQPLS